MPEAHVLRHGQVHEPAEAAGGHDLVDPGVEGRVAQAVADLKQTTGGVGGFHHAQAIRRPRCDGLLQEHVISALDGGHRGLRVDVIGRGDDGDRGQSRARQQVLPVVGAALGRQAMGFGELLQELRIRFGHGDDT